MGTKTWQCCIRRLEGIEERGRLQASYAVDALARLLPEVGPAFKRVP